MRTDAECIDALLRHLRFAISSGRVRAMRDGQLLSVQWEVDFENPRLVVERWVSIGNLRSMRSIEAYARRIVSTWERQIKDKAVD